MAEATPTPEEFKALLLADLDAFNATFTEKLATYGLRRTMSFGDRDDLKAIAAQGKSADYRLRDLVTAFVCSNLFPKTVEMTFVVLRSLFFVRVLRSWFLVGMYWSAVATL